ncbi:Cytochrome p450 [Thalictrum thalictroides]|uniref:Cytochrome p450 n=1 Tax=Thalictrum thalictroides TaxID=46969 RepID=A0A7J6X3X1_THATH|nr:Cytochrome p450 [Thalictrum thalictroides]
MEFLYYFLLTLFILFILKVFSQTNKNLPPRPFALPILGHIHLFKNPLNRTLQTLSNRYGPILFLQFGSRPVLVISSLSLVEECFTKNDIIFANRPISIAGDHISYNYTILTWSPYCYHWRNMRRITTIEIFSAKSLQMSAKIRKEEIHRMVSSLFRRSNCGSQHFDLKFMFSQLMFDIMMRLVAGKRCFEEFMDLNEQKQLHVLLKYIFAPTLQLDLGDFLPILRWIGLCRAKKDMIKLHQKRDSFCQSLINEFRRKKTDSSTTTLAEDKKKATIIEALLSIQEAEPEQYSDDFIKGIIMIMFTAGTDTTSLTLEWAMSLLLNHPDVLQKARSEINHNVQGRLLDDSDLAKLPYLHCIINETLRMHPAAPLLVPHSSSKECTVGGYTVPRETVLYANIGAIHRDPKVWIDPDKFMPERFEGVQSEKEMGFKFMPFGVGRRVCPGANMAMHVVALALGTLIQCFEWERVGQDQVQMHETNSGATTPKANPLIAMCKPYPNMVDTLTLSKV